MTCGKVLADKYEYYCKKVEDLKKQKLNDEKGNDVEEEGRSKNKLFDQIRTGPILDELGLERMCCRRTFLSTVDLVDII
jgi:DNA-directed RNA polymerase subunit N (RpoN/RPB10)